MNLNEIDFKKLHLQNQLIQWFVALIIAIVLVVIGYFAVFQGQWEEYQTNLSKETELKEEYEKKSIQAAGLDNLKQELVDLEKSISVLIKQLPTNDEIPTLLQELHQAAARNGLTLSSLSKGKAVVEKPIERVPLDLSVSGKYDQIAQFARDIGQMSRIVTLSNINLRSNPSTAKGADAGKLTLSAMANTYKALDSSLNEPTSASSASKPKGKDADNEKATN